MCLISHFSLEFTSIQSSIILIGNILLKKASQAYEEQNYHLSKKIVSQFNRYERKSDPLYHHLCRSWIDDILHQKLSIYSIRISFDYATSINYQNNSEISLRFLEASAAPITAQVIDTSNPIESAKGPICRILQARKAIYTNGAITQKAIICVLCPIPQVYTKMMNKPRTAAAMNHPCIKATMLRISSPMKVPVSEFLPGQPRSSQIYSLTNRLTNRQTTDISTPITLPVLKVKAQIPVEMFMMMNRYQGSVLQQSMMAAQTSIKLSIANMTIQILKKQGGGVVERWNLSEVQRVLWPKVMDVQRGMSRVRQAKMRNQAGEKTQWTYSWMGWQCLMRWERCSIIKLLYIYEKLRVT